MSLLEKALIEQLAPQIAKNINMKDLNGSEDFIIDLLNRNSKSLEITINKEPVGKFDNVHYMFETVLKHIETGEPVFLTGPAGSGKSTIAEDVAKALGYQFGSISVCAQTTKSDFLGYRDAHGTYIETIFRTIYENGGVFLIDEIDAGNPNVLAVLNAALSGSQFAFPDRVIKKNPKFLLIATANTVGTGSVEYVGRNQIDAATLDRFNFIHVDYDKELELSLINKKYRDTVKEIQKLRKYILSNRISNIIVSTRSIIKIVKLMMNGFSFEEALESTVFKTSTKKDIKDIMEGYKNG